MKILHIDDEQVRQVVANAARTACRELDGMFPGYDNGGITSNFQGLLEEVLMHMLAGKSVLDAKRGHSVSLPTLVLDDASFGNPLLRGESFVVTRTEEGDWNETTHRHDTQTFVLNDSGTRFVAMDASEQVDPYTSYPAAVKAVLEYLKREEEDTTAPLPQIRPVHITDRGWVFA